MTGLWPIAKGFENNDPEFHQPKINKEHPMNDLGNRIRKAIGDDHPACGRAKILLEKQNLVGG